MYACVPKGSRQKLRVGQIGCEIIAIMSFLEVNHVKYNQLSQTSTRGNQRIAA